MRTGAAMRTKTPTTDEVFREVAKEFAGRCGELSWFEIVAKFKGKEPHGGTYIKDWQICYWSSSVEISVPYYEDGELEFEAYRFTYEKIAHAVVKLRGGYAETAAGQLKFM